MFSLSISKHRDAFKFALFASFLSGVYKAILCIMRRLCNDDRINASIAGFLSAFSILLDDKNRRLFLALIFFSRCLVSIILEVIFMYVGYYCDHVGETWHYKEN